MGEKISLATSVKNKGRGRRGKGPKYGNMRIHSEMLGIGWNVDMLKIIKV